MSNNPYGNGYGYANPEQHAARRAAEQCCCVPAEHRSDGWPEPEPTIVVPVPVLPYRTLLLDKPECLDAGSVLLDRNHQPLTPMSHWVRRRFGQ